MNGSSCIECSKIFCFHDVGDTDWFYSQNMFILTILIVQLSEYNILLLLVKYAFATEIFIYLFQNLFQTKSLHVCIK